MEGEQEQRLLIKDQTSEEESSLVTRVWNESKLMWIVAGPAIFTRFSTFGINVISQAFVGHIGPRELAAFALVFTVLIRFANGILLGMASALSTLCGQAFGAKEYSMMGVYLQRSWIVLFSTAVCLLPLFFFTDPILRLLGQDGNIAQVAETISLCLNIAGWEMMISLGFMAAASVRVANELGKGSSKAAKFSILVSVLTSLVIGFVLFLFFLFLREKLAYVFTTSEEVADAVGDLSPLLAVAILLNSVQPVLSGVAIGAGWQSIVAYVNIGCYYVIGIPVGLVLGEVLHLEVKGIWIGMLFGTFIQTVVLTIITYKTNWDDQVIKARNRVSKWSKVNTDHERITSNN